MKRCAAALAFTVEQLKAGARVGITAVEEKDKCMMAKTIEVGATK